MAVLGAEFIFGEWEGFSHLRLNKLLAKHGLALRVEANPKLWGRKVKLSIETTQEKDARRRRLISEKLKQSHKAKREREHGVSK